MYKYKIQILYTLLLGMGVITAQTTNTGELTVAPGTQFSVVDAFENTNTGDFINDGEALFYNDFSNNGFVDYTVGGLTSFLGVTQQQISGTEPIYLYDMLISNTSGLPEAISLTSTVSVENNIDFNEGIVNTLYTDSQFLLQNTGSVSNVDDASFVDGFFTKQGALDFEFPVGDDEYYRYIAINAPTSVTYKARYVFQDPENTFPSEFRIGNIVSVNDNEYWIVENIEGTQQVEITLSWDEFTTTPDGIVAQEEAIRIARWDFDQNAWVEVPDITVDVVNRTVTATQLIEDTAVYTIARADLNIILPDGVIIWNAVSPDNDGNNDYLRIENVHLLPNNEVHIFNRWGAEVFKTSNYGTTGNTFQGYAKGSSDKLLPSGTYFYVLTYDSNNEGRIEATGYLYLSTD